MTAVLDWNLSLVFYSHPIVFPSFVQHSSSLHCDHARMGVPLAGGDGWPDPVSADPYKIAESVR